MLNLQTFTTKSLFIILLTMISMTFNSCELIGNIFEAGVWVGIIIVVLIIAIIIYIFSKFSRRN